MEPKQVVLASIFGEGMVLQREAAVPLWGTCAPGAQFTLGLAGQSVTVVADDIGAWRATLAPMAAGGPFSLAVDDRTVVQRVWLGDVWLCAGQSNMERSLQASASWPTDAQVHRGDPEIRQLCLPNQFDFGAPRADIPGARWIGADTAEVAQISAVGFHFARDMKAKTGVPQGLILAAVGGATVQAWLSPRTLASFPRHRDEAFRFSDAGWLDRLRDDEAQRTGGWFSRLEVLDPKDPSRAGTGPWNPIDVPSSWASTEVGDVCGSVWYRKSFTLDEVPKGPGKLRLGTLVDSDDVWINGVWVGATGYQYPSRRYEVPASALRVGENSLLVRLVSPRRGGGVTRDKPLGLEVGDRTVDLAGTWEWRPGAFVPEVPADTFLPLISAGLHNGMLVPLAPYALRAVLWYQGESNTHDPSDYGSLMRALLDEWRLLWSQPELPFFLVQLPLFDEASDGVVENGWSEIRDTQRRLAEDGAASLVVTLDLGEWNDIHPAHKEAVGLRLAAAVQFRLFGLGDEPYTGPLVVDAVAEGSAVRVRFDQAQGGLTTNGRPVALFLAGDDGVHHPAEVTIEGSDLVVVASQVPHPRVVTYAWAMNPVGATLSNRAQIPASPFRILVKGSVAK